MNLNLNFFSDMNQYYYLYFHFIVDFITIDDHISYVYMNYLMIYFI